MAITVNSANKSNGMPSAPLRVVTINFDADASYPTGGYPLTAEQRGGTVIAAFVIPAFAAATLRYFKVSPAGNVQAFVDDSGAPGAEVAGAVDLSAYTGLEVVAIVQ